MYYTSYDYGKKSLKNYYDSIHDFNGYLGLSLIRYNNLYDILVDLNK